MIRDKDLEKSKKMENEAVAKMSKESEQVRAEQRRMRKLIRWTHESLNIYTSGQTLNAIHTAVANGLDRWETFLSYTIPVGMRAKLVFATPMRFKQYATGGEEQGRATRLMLGLQKAGKHFVNEICEIPYSKFYDIAWKDQMSNDNRDSLVVDLGGYTEAGFYEQEQIVFQVKNSAISIPSTPHTSTLIAYPIQVITVAELARQWEEIKKAEMRRRGIDAAD